MDIGTSKSTGRFKEAVQCLEKIVSEDKNIISVQYHLGVSYLGLKEVVKAVKCFRKVLELNPEHKGAQEKLIGLHTDQEMLYKYGVTSHKEDYSHEELTMNFHIGQAYKGFGMIQNAFSYFKKKEEK